MIIYPMMYVKITHFLTSQLPLSGGTNSHNRIDQILEVMKIFANTKLIFMKSNDRKGIDECHIS